MKSVHFGLVLALSAVLVAGCGKKDDGHGHKEDGGPKSGPRAPENLKQLKELKLVDVKVGTGPAVKKGDMIFMTYTGKLKNGIQFESNDSPDGAPLGFVIGVGEVVPGWDQGLIGMKVGGVRKLDIPNKLAYGDAERGENVPPGADLYFEAKLLDIIPAGEESIFDKSDLVVGSGREAKVGDLVEVNYVMRLVNGKKVDEFSDPKAPIVFRIGPKVADNDREVPKGVYTAMVGMREGGKRKMRIPPAIGFMQSMNPKLPMNQIVLIEMTLLKIR